MLTDLIEKHNLPLEIINLNSPITITISGLMHHVSLLLEKAVEEGALKTRILKVSVPYHTRYLAPVAESFTSHVREAEIGMPSVPVVSQIDQSILHGPMAIREELVKNLYHHLSFMHTHQRLLELGVKSFVECGPGKSLTRNSRFLEGEFQVLPSCGNHIDFFSPQVAQVCAQVRCIKNGTLPFLSHPLGAGH